MCFDRHLSVLLAFGIFLLTGCTKNDPDPVVQPENIVINEIYSTGPDWLELYNLDNSPKDIGGYAVYDDPTNKYFLPAGTIIGAKGFLVITCDGTATGLHSNFKLSSSGETVYLDNVSQVLIDKVDFPALVTGQSYARIPNGTGSFVTTGSPTQAKDNGGNASPAIADVVHAPLVVGQNDDILVSATVTDAKSVSSVTLHYRLGSASYLAIPMSLTTANVYTAKIPATHADGVVSYYVEATNSVSLSSLSPETAPLDVYSYLINSDALPNLVINEFMASNASCCPDGDSGADEYDDWIEIYNAGDVAVNVANMYFSDDAANPFKYKVPSTNTAKTTIQPKGYLVVWADNSPTQGVVHASFKLSAAGGNVGVYYIDGRTIDAYIYGAQTTDISFGRVSDGASTWKAFSSPTQGSANQ